MSVSLRWSVLLIVAVLPAQTALAQASFSTVGTPLGTMLDSSAARPIVLKYLTPLLSANQMTMLRPLTLKQIQALAPKILTDNVLAQIDADLASTRTGA